MSAALEEAVAAVVASPDYRVLSRLPKVAAYLTPTPLDGRRFGLYVDVETTGIDSATCQLIELGMVSFEFDADGNIYKVADGWSFLNDPGVPIPEEVVALTGITDAQVKGQSIDWGIVEHEVGASALVIAHHADFDRRVLERFLPSFADKAWACSYKEIDWKAFGCTCAKLPHLLTDACGVFYEAHRALDDCRAGVHLLASARHDDLTAMTYLLQSARQDSYRVWAVQAPFAVKDVLKARGYRWCDGTTGRFKAWHTEVRADAVDEEVKWLTMLADVRQPVVEKFNARDRYSARCAA